MNFKDLGSLLNAMKQCRACSFANPHIAPLVPREKDVPVQIMFIGENPSWAGDQEEPFALVTISGKALKEHYLYPLGLARQQV